MEKLKADILTWLKHNKHGFTMQQIVNQFIRYTPGAIVKGIDICEALFALKTDRLIYAEYNELENAAKYKAVENENK